MSKSLPVERPYESLFICPSDTPQKTIDGFIDKLKATISQAKGTVRSVQIWGRRRLTYPIKHQKDGLYIYVDFNSETGAPEALKNLYRVTDIVLRHLTVERVEYKEHVRRIPTPEGAPAAVPAAAATEAAPVISPESPAKESPSTPKEG